MKRKIEVTYCYEIEINELDSIVKEYADESELITDLCNYRFQVLPVLKEGVKIIDIEYLEHEIV